LAPRVPTEQDADGIAALLTELGYPTVAADAQRRILEALADPAACVLVADDGSDVVGLLAARTDRYFPSGSKLFRVTALAVAGAHRGKGIGRALMAHAMEIAASRGCAGVELTTGEHRVDAQAFYERLGFKRTSVRYFRGI
jgi:ribosomal protein S18 acetylase RimI-like enzyme